MLLELKIQDFAIIESLTLTFGKGLIVFSGETGAGKSIIIDAIALILGDRASNEIIRSNKEEAQVEAMFDVTNYKKGIGNVLDEAGIPHTDQLVIKRVVQRAGRNKIYINGSLATLVTLTEVCRRLIDIYGQSEHQSLTRPEEHIEILDAFGGFQKLRFDMAESCKAFVAIKKELEALTQNPKSAAEKAQFLSHQIKEITDAGLRPGEDFELRVDYERLKNAEKIKSAVVLSEKSLYSDAGSVVEKVGAVVKNLKDAGQFDEQIAKNAAAVESSMFQLEEAARFLRDYTKSIEADPDALDRIGAKLDIITKLKKKFGATIAEILEKKAALEVEMESLAHVDEKIKDLTQKIAAAKEKADADAYKLTEARKAASFEMKGRIELELETLGMKGSIFDVKLETDKNPDGSLRFTEKGADRVSFMISPNPGEGVKPLSRIASGGELSRIMLAMKSVTAVGKVPTLIFDEIDTGVSGAMAQVVGLKLKEVGKLHQVLSITHLPQIAAFADTHYAVSKSAVQGRTLTTVKELPPAEQVEQLAVMLGGTKVTDVTREHAKELMETAKAMVVKKEEERKEEDRKKLEDTKKEAEKKKEEERKREARQEEKKPAEKTK